MSALMENWQNSAHRSYCRERNDWEWVLKLCFFNWSFIIYLLLLPTLVPVSKFPLPCFCGHLVSGNTEIDASRGCSYGRYSEFPIFLEILWKNVKSGSCDPRIATHSHKTSARRLALTLPALLPLPPSSSHFLRLQTFPCSAAELWSWKTRLRSARGLLQPSQWACRPSMFRKASEVGQMVRKLTGLWSDRASDESLPSGFLWAESTGLWQVPLSHLESRTCSLCIKSPLRAALISFLHARSWLSYPNKVETKQKVSAECAAQRNHHEAWTNVAEASLLYIFTWFAVSFASFFNTIFSARWLRAGINRIRCWALGETREG